MATAPHPLAFHVPDCRYAACSVASLCPGAPRILLIHCKAPSDLKSLCCYPADLCPHRGPYRDLDEAAEELAACTIRQALRLS